MKTAHKIALNPNNQQRTYLSKAAGTARFAYNWALAEWQRQYQAKKRDHSLLLHRKASYDACSTPLSENSFLGCLKRPNARRRKRFAISAGRLRISSKAARYARPDSEVDRIPRFKKKGQHDAFTILSPCTKVEEVCGRRRAHFWIPKLDVTSYVIAHVLE